eukprot:11198429-Lingulodinium_polyedra.AAC.1
MTSSVKRDSACLFDASSYMMVRRSFPPSTTRNSHMLMCLAKIFRTRSKFPSGYERKSGARRPGEQRPPPS